MCFILTGFWENTGQIAQSDEFVFEVDAACGTIEMPVLFSGGAYSTNHVNSLVDGGTVYSGKTLESGTGGVFADYVENAFGKAGCSVVFADTLDYHLGGGELHCDTNAMR